MKTILIFFFIALFAQQVAAQALYVDSTRFITGLRPSTRITYAIPTADKGILFVGEDAENPGGIIPYFATDTGVNGNVLIGKIDSNQQISWIKVYGGTDADAAVSACQTSDGGYAILAGTASSNGDVTGYRGGGGDYWLLRVDAHGDLLWEQTYGSSAQDAPTSIANTLDHGFIMSGTTNGSDGDVPFHYGDFYSFDWLVIKTDSMGNFQWSKDLGSSNDEGNTGAILSIDSSYYLISNTGSLDHDCTDTAWHPGVHTGYDLYILKLNDTGKVLWDSSYGGTGTDGANCALFDARDSTIVINGFTYSNDYMVTGYQGEGDMWVVKIKKDGTLVWEKTLGSPRPETGTGICATSSNGYIVYGSTSGVIGGGDGWVISIDSAGNELANKIFGGTGNELACSIVPYLSGYVATGLSGSKYFTEGSTYGNFDSNALNPEGGGGFISYIDTGMNVGTTVVKAYPQPLSIYPNPANNSVTVITPNEDGYITIVNAMGQTLLKSGHERNDRSLIVSVKDWWDGVYFIRWDGADGEAQTGKFIKQ